MKFAYSLLVVPLVITLSACSTHYRASSHHGYKHHRHGHVSVGVHGHHHGRGGSILGALVVGGVIGHLLTEAHKKDAHAEHVVVPSDEDDELVNGYTINDENELSEEQKRWYQLGKNGKCYLMETINGKTDIISLVPINMCG
ncbi:hypothetical protein [Aliikangiella sp. IMCC44359]|uniref:hypothetical protein n=1 Tax=Aliikangiella sp. IMCC44359 TaxID=3459125 RepID=UPI00403B10DD